MLDLGKIVVNSKSRLLYVNSSNNRKSSSTKIKKEIFEIWSNYYSFFFLYGALIAFKSDDFFTFSELTHKNE